MTTKFIEPIISVQMWNDWLQTSRRGQEIEYHFGMLASDRHIADSMPPNERAARKDLVKLANAVFKASTTSDEHGMPCMGLVELVQRRVSPGRYSYLARKL